MRSIILVSDAYGGRGGIALYNRHFLKAICSYPKMFEVVAVPRSISYELEEMPKNLKYASSAAGSKFKFMYECLKQLFSKGKFDVIVCGHIHLLPLAFFLKFFFRCPLVTLTYGVEAWTPSSRWIVNYLCSKIDMFISIRKLTAHRFKKWANIQKARFYYLPNCIDDLAYGIDDKRPDLMEKYDLNNMLVIMTAGRLDNGEIDKNKGFDEVIELLPELRKEITNLRYIIVGDGNDKSRLQEKARLLNVDDIIKFIGYVSEKDKADYYRLADVFVMPGSNTIFDRYPFRFVFLEALACGVPVVGCILEDISERNDTLAQKLIIQVDPKNPDDVKRGILKGIEIPKEHKSGIENFYYIAFEEKLHSFLDNILVRTR